MEITIRLNADEMLKAAARGLFEELAKCGKSALQQGTAEIPVQHDTQEAALLQEVQDSTAQSVPQTAVPVEAPVEPIQSTPATIPTQQVTYTQEDLALAATQLVDAGKLGQVQELLAKFDVQALTLLPKEQYGAFASELRNMGAKI